MNPYDISPADQDPRSDFWGSYPEGFVCRWCGITEVKDEDDKCMECRVCEAEYKDSIDYGGVHDGMGGIISDADPGL